MQRRNRVNEGARFRRSVTELPNERLVAPMRALERVQRMCHARNFVAQSIVNGLLEEACDGGAPLRETRMSIAATMRLVSTEKGHPTGKPPLCADKQGWCVTFTRRQRKLSPAFRLFSTENRSEERGNQSWATGRGTVLDPEPRRLQGVGSRPAASSQIRARVLASR